MREIPPLQTLCLRSVGGKSCSAEVTFARIQNNGQLSTASRLLRSYHARRQWPSNETPDHNDDNDDDDDEIHRKSAISKVPLERIPAIGMGSARRKQASEVDLNHPWIAVYQRHPQQRTTSEEDEEEHDDPESKNSLMIAEYNSTALDVLQSYVDSLVELSCMDDSRLGIHFFEEWKANVLLAHGILPPEPTTVANDENYNHHQQEEEEPPQQATRSKKRRKPTPVSSSHAAAAAIMLSNSNMVTAVGSLSLHNTIIQEETIQAMVESQMTFHLAVLDCTGIQTLTDELLGEIITRAPNLVRLSIKNCRRLTATSLVNLAEHATHLQSLDIGGSYNLAPSQVIELIAALQHLNELHASGLLWTDALLLDLTSIRSWKALSLGFCLPDYVSAEGLKQALISQTASLTSLALPFCEHLLDAAMLGVLGRHLPNLRALDVRGNGQLSSMTGWYDGRATIHPMVRPLSLFVLGRYSGLTKSSIDDTKRIHPLQAMDLTVILDSEGVGMGIQRKQQNVDNDVTMT